MKATRANTFIWKAQLGVTIDVLRTRWHVPVAFPLCLTKRAKHPRKEYLMWLELIAKARG